MRIGQRVIDVSHGVSRKRAPCAADHIHRAGVGSGPADRCELFVHCAFECFRAFRAKRGQAKGAQPQARCFATVIVGDRNQFEAAPAEIGDDTLRTGKGPQSAHGRSACLFLARQKAWCQPEFRDGLQEFPAIFRIAGRCGCNGLHVFHAEIGDDERIACERSERLVPCFLRDPSAIGKVAAKARSDFLVPDHFGRTPGPFVDDHAHRIRTDVDHRARRLDQAALPFGRTGFVHVSAPPRVRRGTS